MLCGNSADCRLHAHNGRSGCEEHIEEFHLRMNEAPARRREGNVRLRARDGMPIPPKRFMPKEVRKSLTTLYAKKLEYRTGWYGLEVRQPTGGSQPTGGEGRGSPRLFALFSHLGSSYVVDLEHCRIG